MLSDIEHFRAKLSKIDGAGEVADRLLKVVQGKPVSDEPKLEPESESTSEKQEDSASTKS